MRRFFTATIFLGAFLLFLVEPMAAKVLLPRFGGSAAVWTTSLLFFQLVLLAGYAYANWLSKRPRSQVVIHMAVLAGAALMAATPPWLARTTDVPIPGGLSQSFQVLFALARTIGLPFFFLSAGTPLLQRAFSRTSDPDRHQPYFLYAASNLGSLLALLAYPALVEPFLRLPAQKACWSLVFILLGLAVCLALGLGSAGVSPAEGEAAPPKNREAKDELNTDHRPNRRDKLKWVALSAAPSSLLLGVTTYLTTNVAPIPLLWVVPLALYLLTFIIAFARRPVTTAEKVGRWVPMAVTPLAIALVLESSTPIVPLALFHLGVFLLVALACHLRLSESRPDPAHLTEFYLWVSVGGAVGGLFNALIAPHLFVTVFEYPLALAAAVMLVSPRSSKDSEPQPLWVKSDWLAPVGVGVLALVAVLGVQAAQLAPSPPRTLLTIGLPCLVCFLVSERRIRYGLSLLALFVVANVSHVAADGTVVFAGRSFYGVHRVVDNAKEQLRKLAHGNTIHGIQSLDPARAGEPLTYYSRTGPAGSIFRAFEGLPVRRNVALVGLGVGSLAAYGKRGEAMSFFEIDPVVIHIASDPKLFTFLSGSRANISITEGDGRLTMAAQADGSFGLIVLDAFSSDAIPVHLLTEEALKLYLRKLAPNGVLAFHVSNNYLNLAPVLAAEARDLHLVQRFDDDSVLDDTELASGKTASKWMVVARNESDLGLLATSSDWAPSPVARRGWTDDYSNVLGAFSFNL